MLDSISPGRFGSISAIGQADVGYLLLHFYIRPGPNGQSRPDQSAKAKSLGVMNC